MTEFKLPIRSRVKLKPDYTDVYPLAAAGSEGVVVKHRIEAVGDYRMVYVKWDHDHWAYQGEADMWTFEDHFELIEPPAEIGEESKDSPQGLLEQFIALIQDSRKDSGLEEEYDYIEVLNEASAAAAEAEAFLTITVKSQVHSKTGEHVLIPYVYSSYQTEEAGLLLEAQISNIGAKAHQEAVLDLMTNIVRDRKKP
jgi:hypothetical protein